MIGPSGLYWGVRGNYKVLATARALQIPARRAATFSLPSLYDSEGRDNCPYARECAAYCYARQGRYLLPSVDDPRQRNSSRVRELLAPMHGWRVLANALVDDVRALGLRLVRVHDSGDFFSPDYLRAWLRASETLLKDAIVYTYTKALPRIVHDVGWAHVEISGLLVTQSYGGSHDHLIDPGRSHAIVFAHAWERHHAGYVDGNGPLGDLPVIRGDIRIGLVYHGTTPVERHRGTIDRVRTRIAATTTTTTTEATG